MTGQDVHTASEIAAFNDLQLYDELMARPYTQALKRAVTETLRGYALKRARILEIGAGVSQFGALFGEHNRVVLTDLNRKLLSQNPPGSVLAVCDAEALPFKEGAFGFVYAIGVFHHLADQSRCLREIRRVLKHDGRMFTCEPHRASLNLFYHTGRLVVMKLLGVGFVKKLIGCFSPDEAQLDVKAVKRAFGQGFQVRSWTILVFRLPPFRIFRHAKLDVTLSRQLDRIPGLNRLGTTILMEAVGEGERYHPVPQTLGMAGPGERTGY